MNTHQCYQVISLLSFLGAFSLTAANPLPQNSDASDLDYLTFLNGDDLGSSDVNLNDASAWAPDQSNQLLSFDSTTTTDLSNLNPIDGSSIAYGDTLKAPYCGTTEQPVCCTDLASFSDCKYFDPTDFENCQGNNQACCGSIIGGIGSRCYKGIPERVVVQPSPGEAPEVKPEPAPEPAPEQQPAYQYQDPFSWPDWLRLAPFTIPWPNVVPAGR